MKGLFSSSVKTFHSAPSLFEISELCIFGFSCAIFRRWPRDQTMKAFIGLLMWSPLLLGLISGFLQQSLQMSTDQRNYFHEIEASNGEQKHDAQVASIFFRTLLRRKIKIREKNSVRSALTTERFTSGCSRRSWRRKGRIKRRVFHHCVGYCCRTDNGRERGIFVGRQWRHKGRLFCFDAMSEAGAVAEGVGAGIGGWGKCLVERAREKKTEFNEGLKLRRKSNATSKKFL